MRFFKYIVVIFLLMDSCIQPFSIDLGTQEAYIVDGEITDKPGPYTVKIFKPIALQDQLNEIKWVQGASVSFLDGNGNVDAALHEISPGNYQTDSAYLGVVGNTYQLRFTTGEGEEYQSTAQPMLPVGDIDSLYYQFVENESPLSYDQVNTSNGFNIFLNGKLTPEQQGLVRWRWTGIFGIKTFPELRVKAANTKTPSYVPDPPPCSGYSLRLEYFGSCTCCYCWATQYSTDITLSNEKFVNKDRVTGQQIAFVEASRRYLYDKYYIEVEQMSVSQDVYDFWTKVVAEQSNGSNLFQTPPASSPGNIQAVTGKIRALGIFAVSSVKTRSLVLTKAEVPYSILPIDTIANSCLAAYPNSVTRKPPFW